MRNLSVLVLLFAVQSAFAGRVDCYGGSETGQLFQVLDVTGAGGARVISAHADLKDPKRLKVDSDETYKLKNTGSAQVELDTTVKLDGSSTSVNLYPVFSAETKTVEGPGKISVVLAQTNKKAFGFTGKLEISGPGLFSPPVPLRCHEQN